jgi:hypothetical protein
MEVFTCCLPNSFLVFGLAESFVVEVPETFLNTSKVLFLF